MSNIILLYINLFCNRDYVMLRLKENSENIRIDSILASSCIQLFIGENCKINIVRRQQ